MAESSGRESRRKKTIGGGVSAKHLAMLKVDKETFKTGLNRHIHYTLMKDKNVAESLDYLRAMCLCGRDLLALRWLRTQQTYFSFDAKVVITSSDLTLVLFS